jgi:hypothetical protein
MQICLPAECTKEGTIAKIYAELDERLTKFIVAKPIFFVVSAPCLATSPARAATSISHQRATTCHPEGYRDTFAILGRGRWPA